MDIKSSGVQGTAGGTGTLRPYMGKTEVYILLPIEGNVKKQKN